MNVLAISDIHNDIENIINFSDKLSKINFDVIVCPGDFTDIPPKGFTALDIGKLILEELRTFNKPILTVPGTWDFDLIDFFNQEDVSIHGKGKIIKDVGFYGFGGAKTPFNTPFEPSESDIEAGLKKGYGEVKNCKLKIQVTHAPPARTKLDLIYTGAHVGSEVVRKNIEQLQPQAAVCAHIHEGRGIEEIGKTKIVNAGRFPEGYCGLISIDDKEVTARIINLT